MGSFKRDKKEEEDGELSSCGSKCLQLINFRLPKNLFLFTIILKKRKKSKLNGFFFSFC